MDVSLTDIRSVFAKRTMNKMENNYGLKLNQQRQRHTQELWAEVLATSASRVRERIMCTNVGRSIIRDAKNTTIDALPFL
jgi:hypothetical protein